MTDSLAERAVVEFERLLADGGALTDGQAERILAVLAKHFKQPVMPIKRYCDGLRTWQQCMKDRCNRTLEALYPGILSPDVDAKTREALWERYRTERDDPDPLLVTAHTVVMSSRLAELNQLRAHEQACNQIDWVFVQIEKSNLLVRILYAGEKLRARMCPVHKGVWIGCFADDPGCGCLSGANVTGWLKEG